MDKKDLIFKQNISRGVKKLHKGLQKILHFSGESRNIDFYISALTEYNPFYSTEEIKQWLINLNIRQHFFVSRIPIAGLKNWTFNSSTGDLEHTTGGFFSIRGLKVKTGMGFIPEWSQPIIYQPEIGILGIITKKIGGILYFLMQAKPEPGNLNTYQLSPTVQATRSNYTRLHGGKKTRYIEHFLGSKKAYVLIDQLQSEQGARFYHKRNRNIIVRLRDRQDVKVGSNFRWLTLGQIQELAQFDNVVNMDTRSIISEINFDPEVLSSLEVVDFKKLKTCLEGSSLVRKPVSDFAISLMISSHPSAKPLHTMEELLQKITQGKFKIIIERELIPLKKVERWVINKNEIFHDERRYFSVIGVGIKGVHREVPSWDQPIIKQQDPGIVGFIVKKIVGILHFLVQLKMESGVMDLLEISPTVQCITDNYSMDDMPPYTDRFLNRRDLTTIIDVYQSEEGGRFYQESNQNIVLLANQKFQEKEPPFYMWVSLKQLKEFIKFNNFVNIEARSLLACLKMV